MKRIIMLRNLCKFCMANLTCFLLLIYINRPEKLFNINGNKVLVMIIIVRMVMIMSRIIRSNF